MAEKQDKTPAPQGSGKADPGADGVLPDGVRGTTRDTGHTVPHDEHAGYGTPHRPDLLKGKNSDS